MKIGPPPYSNFPNSSKWLIFISEALYFLKFFYIFFYKTDIFLRLECSDWLEIVWVWLSCANGSHLWLVIERPINFNHQFWSMKIPKSFNAICWKKNLTGRCGTSSTISWPASVVQTSSSWSPTCWSTQSTLGSRTLWPGSCNSRKKK